MWLTILNWVIGFFKKPKQSPPVGPTLTIQGQGNIGQQMTESPSGQQAANVTGSVHQAQRDIIINEAPAKEPLPHWLDRPGGPQFDRLNPGREGADNPRLLCEFEIDADPQPSRVEARWVGAGTESTWVEPMREASRRGPTYRRFQMKAVGMKPTPPADEVTFQVRFTLEDGEHGGRWTWPLEQHQKGHWDLRADLGSGVRQPNREDTW